MDCAAEGGTAPTHRVAAAAEGRAESAEGHATNVIHDVPHQFPALFQARRQASTQEEAERAGAAHKVEAEFPEEAEARRAVVLGEEGNALGDDRVLGVLQWRPRYRLRDRHVPERDFEVHELLRGEVVLGKCVEALRSAHELVIQVLLPAHSRAHSFIIARAFSHLRRALGSRSFPFGDKALNIVKRWFGLPAVPLIELPQLKLLFFRLCLELAPVRH